MSAGPAAADGSHAAVAGPRARGAPAWRRVGRPGGPPPHDALQTVVVYSGCGVATAHIYILMRYWVSESMGFNPPQTHPTKLPPVLPPTKPPKYHQQHAFVPHITTPAKASKSPKHNGGTPPIQMPATNSPHISTSK